MSFSAENWAWAQKCPSSSAKLLLVCLGRYADTEGDDAYPSMATIVRKTQMVERTIRNARDELVKAKLIEQEQRYAPNGRCISTLYRLRMGEPTTAKMQGSAPVEKQGSDHSKYAGDTPVFSQGILPLKSKKEFSLRSNSENILFDDAGKPAPRKRRAPVEAKTALPADWQPNADLCAEVAAMGLDPVAVTRNVHQYWRLGQGEGVARTLRGWNQTYLNSADFLLRNGKCIMRSKVNGIDPGPRMVPL